MDNTNNKEYWNAYVTYWENKVNEANTDNKINDKTNDDQILETYFKKLDIQITDVVLDYGCGSGRLFPIYQKTVNEKSQNYYGIDVSSTCLEHAQNNNPGIELGRNLKEFDGIKIPFQNGFFDKIVCFGVFDACKQEIVLGELLRVLKPGGVLLLTGKNKQYYSDDHEAAVAEVNARKKGHPNYFTDIHSMLDQLREHNVEIKEQYYFLRRGDFPKNKAVIALPEVFYEWAVLLKKKEPSFNNSFSDFSYAFSDTYLEGQDKKDEQTVNGSHGQG